jgi:F-type H+-transporting ATPase subunit gamma
LGLQIVLRRRPELLEPEKATVPVRLGMIVFGSDQGLCGPVNRHVAEFARQRVGRSRPPEREQFVAAVGLRQAAELRAVGLPPQATFREAVSPDAIARDVQDLLAQIDVWRSRHRVTRVDLVHPRPLTSATATYEPVLVQLWPISPDHLRSLADRPWFTNNLPTFTMDWPDVFSGLIRQYLLIALERAYAESLAGVAISRVSAMQAAELNIEERLSELTGRYQRERQASITEEILDVTSGYEALSP